MSTASAAKFFKKAMTLTGSNLISFCFGFIACLVLTMMFYRFTTSRFKTTKELHLHSPKTENVIIIPAGVELIQTEKIDDYLFNDDTYYLSIGLYPEDVTPTYKLGFKEIWLHSKKADQKQ